jgi:hypothetical protein
MIFASTINYVSSHVIVYVLEVLEFCIFWYWLVLSSTTGLDEEGCGRSDANERDIESDIGAGGSSLSDEE